MKNRPPTFADKFPNVSGCYIISDNGVVLYVGQSKNVHRRWTEHHRKELIEKVFPNATVEVVPCEIEKLLETEAQLIKSLKPEMNDICLDDLKEKFNIPNDWYLQNE